MGGETHVFVDSRESLAVVLELRGEHLVVHRRARRRVPALMRKTTRVPVSARKTSEESATQREAPGGERIFVNRHTESRGRAVHALASDPFVARLRGFHLVGLLGSREPSARPLAASDPPFAVGQIF